MKANQHHITGLNCELFGTDWKAKRCRTTEQSILIGNENFERCVLVTIKGEKSFVTIHEDVSAEEMSEKGFVGVMNRRYMDERFKYWNALVKFLIKGANVDYKEDVMYS